MELLQPQEHSITRKSSNWMGQMINPLDGRNTKELKNQKPKLLFFGKHWYFSQIVKKKPKY